MHANPETVRGDIANQDPGEYFTRGLRFSGLASAIHREQPGSLLVIGCGNGYLESILSESIETLSLDRDDGVLEDARMLNRGKPGRKFLQLDLREIPGHIPAGSFEGVVLSEVIEHHDDDLQALQIAWDTLRPGGTLFLTLPNVQRFTNRLRTVLRRKPKYMSRFHRREYTLPQGLELISRARFTCKELRGLDFWFPMDAVFRWMFAEDNFVRRKTSQTWPGVATWYLLVCQKSE